MANIWRQQGETESTIVAAQDQVISADFNIIHVSCSKIILTSLFQ
jgi:hypothetical protein